MSDIPGSEEIALHDLMRKGGVRNDVAQAFLAHHRIARNTEGARFEISRKVDGRVYIDFPSKDAAEAVRTDLLKRAIEATVHTGDGAPQNGSSLYIDGVHLRDFLEKQHPDFTKDPKRFDKVVAAPVRGLLQATQALGGGMNGVRATSLLQAANDTLRSATPEAMQQSAVFLKEAANLVGELRMDLPEGKFKAAEGLRRDIHGIAQTLQALEAMGSAPRSEAVRGGWDNYAVYADGKRVNTGGLRSGVNSNSRLGPGEHNDLTLAANAALPHFTAAERAQYGKYLQSFKADGLQTSHLLEHGGTLREFLAELTNPKSAMAVALKEATQGKEKPAAQAVAIEKIIGDTYKLAMTGHPDRQKMLEKWTEKGSPWLDISAAAAGRMIDEADKAPKGVRPEQLAPIARELIEKHAGPAALELPSSPDPKAQGRELKTGPQAPAYGR